MTTRPQTQRPAGSPPEIKIPFSRQPLSHPPSNPQTQPNFVQDEAVLVAALVLRLSKRLGRSHEAMPLVIRRALGDLCSEGDPTAWLLYSWLQDEPAKDKPYVPLRQRLAHRAPPPSGSRMVGTVVRHGRPWRKGSIALRRLDEARYLKLLELLAEEMKHVES